MQKTYFDYASTTPMDSRVLEAMGPYFFEKFGNASSPHIFGQEARKALEESREFVAQCVGAKSKEIIFNSGATEGNNHALIGVARAQGKQQGHIIISSFEHHSVSETAEFLKTQGFKVTYLNVDADGIVNPEDVHDALTDETILVAVMHANNEIGTIQPIEEIGKIVKEHKAIFFVDAVQTVGHMSINVDELGVDLLSMSAHKFYGPKGVGALYVRNGIKIEPFLLGGDQENSRRASTQNVAGIVGLAKALRVCEESFSKESDAQKHLRDKLLREVPARIDGVKVNGHLTKRLVNNAHFAFEHVESEALLMSLDMAGFAASMGSACSSGAMEPSHALEAIGLSDDYLHGALRVTIGRWTSEEQIDSFLEQLPGIVEGLRN